MRLHKRLLLFGTSILLLAACGESSDYTSTNQDTEAEMTGEEYGSHTYEIK